jgi:dipeptidase E
MTRAGDRRGHDAGVTTDRHIVAMGGGGFSMEPHDTRLDDFVLGLAGASRPRVCFLPTPAGDDPAFVRMFRHAFRTRAEPTAAITFWPAERPVADLLAEADVVYVPGGNTVNALAVWRAQGLDHHLRAAWERGAVLAGPSAGAVCWFEAGVTDAYALDPGLGPLTDGLGFVPGSCCPHANGEPGRREAHRDLVGRGVLPAGWSVDDFAALHFVGTDLVEVVTSRDGPAVHWIERDGDGVREERLPSRVLP